MTMLNIAQSGLFHPPVLLALLFLCHSLGDPSGRSLTGLIRADGLDAATGSGSGVAFR